MSELVNMGSKGEDSKGPASRGLRGLRTGKDRNRAIARAKKLVLGGASLDEAALAVGLTGRSLDRVSREEGWIEQRADTRAGALAVVGLDWPTERERYRARAYTLGQRWLDMLDALPAEDVHKAVATFATLDRAMRALVGLGDGNGPGGVTILSPAVSILSSPGG